LSEPVSPPSPPAGPPRRADFFWLFFGLRGRVGRYVFLLASLLLSCAVGFPYYRYVIAVPDSPSAQGWAAVFGAVFVAGLWSTVALGVKRMHDFGKPGPAAVSLVMPVISIVAFVALCLIPGTPGANEYGERTDAPN
jgi:uncharacterized membrane protein YhaH (DUF805 family)